LKAVVWIEREISRRLDLAAVGLLLFGALVRVVGFLQNASLNGDEAMLALSIGPRSFRQLLQPLDYGQVATVPFLWAERLVTVVGGVSGYTLRVIPLLAGIGLLWVVYRLAQELLGRIEALVALALTATAFPLIRYSVEVKPYILDSLGSAGLIWLTVRLLDKLEDRRLWAWLAVSGAVGVFLSAPALLVGGALLVGLAIAAVRRRRPHLLLRLAFLGALWGGIFGAAYVNWYATNASAPYMRAYWAEAFLRPGIPRFFSRLWRGLGDLSCTLTCWRGFADLSPLLLLLALVGLANMARRRGPERAVLLAGPILAAFGASALGQYPIATRLVLFSAPFLAILVAAGAVAVATTIEHSWPRIRARWVLLLFLYPSLILAARLALAPPSDWGFHGDEVRPLAELYRLRDGREPAYIFPRTVAAWLFHTTDWSAPDTARLRRAAEIAGPDGLGFVNGPSRGPRPLGEGAELVYTHGGRKELYGTTTGAQGRVGVGYSPPEPDPGWADSEAWRMRSAASPYVWVVMSDYVHGRLDERAILMKAVQAAGGEVVYTKAIAGAVLYRVRFRPGPGP
jgi:hypothetical protein